MAGMDPRLAQMISREALGRAGMTPNAGPSPVPGPTAAPGPLMGTEVAGEGQQSQTEANYRPAESPERSCANCIHFDGEGGCEVVAGEIRPDGTSDNFEPAGGGGMASSPSASAGSPYEQGPVRMSLNEPKGI